MESNSWTVIRPFATHLWLLATITWNPARLSKEMASAAPGRNCISSQRVMYWPSAGFRLMTPSRSRNALFIIEQFLLYQFRYNVSDQDVAFLNSRGIVRWYADTVIYSLPEISPGATGQGDRVQTHFLGHCYGSNYFR